MRRNHDELRRISNDPVACHQFLLRASLIESTRKARLIA